MAKNKKILLTVLSVALVAIIGIFGTVAYLTDTESAVNVMTMGNVDIAQHEYERVQNADGTYATDTIDGQTTYVLKDFTQEKPLYPATAIDANGNIYNYGAGNYESTRVKMSQVGSHGSMDVFENENAVDKFVTVENKGKTDAYVRTIYAFEIGSKTVAEFDNLIRTSSFMTDQGVWKVTDIGIAAIDGNNYYLCEYIYNGAADLGGVHANGVLPAGDTTYPGLCQVYMTGTATNEDVAALDGNANGTYDILVLSQAVQAEGFADAETALDTAFGDVTTDSAAAWFFAILPGVVSVDNEKDLVDAVENATEPTTILLADGEYTTNMEVPDGSDITIIGSGNTVLNGQIASTSSTEGTVTLKNLTVNVDDNIKDNTGISQTGKSAIALWGNQTVVCENVTFNMSLSNSTAITSWWDTGIGTSIVVKDCTFNCNGQRPIRATGNVTVENTTFNDPYRYAVQLTAKASTATLLDKAIINFNGNKIIDGPNGKNFVYGIQLEGADYGCNDCVINGTGNTIVNGGADSAMYYCECGKVVHETIEWNVEVPAVHEN